MNSKYTKFLEIFSANYYSHLSIRRDTFLQIFNYLSDLDKEDYYIVETGTVRNTDIDIRKRMRDGYSTVLFDEFVKILGGKVLSIDINEENCNISRKACSTCVDIVNAESVGYLWNDFSPSKPIDLLYLDSFDLDVENPQISALHHMKEFVALERYLSNGTLVVVDDHVDDNTGKGMYIHQLFNSVGIAPLFKDYQIGWVYKR